MRWTDLPIHFIDFEGSTGSGILEFGVVTLRGGEIVETRTRLCRATGRIREEDSAVHHLSASEVAGGAPFAEEFDYFAGLREAGPFAAHFAGAENSLLKSVWPYARLSADFSKPGVQTTEWGPWIDTGRLAGELAQAAGSLQLETLVVSLGLQHEIDLLAGRHCPPDRRFFHAALYDALAGARVLQSLLERCEPAQVTLRWLLQQSTGSAQKRSDMQQDMLF